MFEMRFRGLLTHARIAYDGKERQLVVFYSVKGVPHCPALGVPRDALVSPAKGDYARGSVIFFRLQGRASIRKIPRGLPELYLDGVPRLTKIGNGVGKTPHYQIRRGRPRRETPVLMTLPKGRLVVLSWFKKQGVFGYHRPQCVPESTAFQSDTNDRVEIRIDRRRVVTVKRDSTVEVTNVPCEFVESGVAVSSHPHIHAERAFFAQRHARVDDPREARLNCTRARSNPPGLTIELVSVECSNTQFP